MCLRHAVVQFKVAHRLHWSKARLSWINSDVDPTCDRCIQAPATLLHMFWTCPRLFTFWQSVFGTFTKILGRVVQLSPLIAIFGVTRRILILDGMRSAWCPSALSWPEDEYCLDGRILLHRCIVIWLGKSCVILNWKRLDTPSGGATGKFYRIWQPFLFFVRDMDADSIVIWSLSTVVFHFFFCCLLIYDGLAFIICTMYVLCLARVGVVGDLFYIFCWCLIWKNANKETLIKLRWLPHVFFLVLLRKNSNGTV